MGFISGALRPRLLLVVSLMVAAHVLTVSPHSCFAGRSTSTTAAGRSSVSLRLVHRDAPCSELKSPSVEASRQSLPDGMPLKELLVKGRAMRERERALRGKMPSKKRAGSAAAATFSYLGLSPGDTAGGESATEADIHNGHKYPRPAPHLRYTRLVPPLGDLYYYVGLSGISVGQSRLDIPSRYLAGSKSGEGGSIFDSRTAITHLRRPIYDALVKAMASQTAHLRPFITSERDLCYNISADAADLPCVPSITLHLLGGVDMELDFHSVLFPEDMVGDVMVVCLAFAGDLGGSSINIIGNYQHQNYWVEYDLENSRLGIAKADCAKF